MPWKALWSAGFRFCWVRLCYGSTPDIDAAYHVAGAQEVGMAVGGYIYTTSVHDYERQLDVFLARLAYYGLGSEGSLIPAVDIEEANPTKEYLDASVNMLDAVCGKYGASVLYTGCAYFETHLRAYTSAKTAVRWLARYPAAPGDPMNWAGNPDPRVPAKRPSDPPFGLGWSVHQERVTKVPGVYDQLLDQNVTRDLGALKLRGRS